MMVEVPAAALKIETFLPHLDFVSIGTNDLTQYTLAAERGNAALAGLADGLDPGVLRLVDAVCRAAAGRFEVGGHNAGRAMGCALEVSKPGKHLKTVRMMDVCFRSKKTQNYDLPCGSSEGKITLE